MPPEARIFDVLEAADVELPAHLLEDLEEVAAARRRRVEADGVEILAEGLGHPDRLELLVLQRVDQGDAAHLRVHDLVEGGERLHGVAEEEHEGVGDGARRVGVDQLGRLRDGHAVAAADEGIALDHGGQRRVHAPRPEGDDLALARRALAPGGLGGDAGGLAEEPEERRLVFRPLDVGALDDEHRLMRAEQRPLVHGPDVDREPLEQGRRFLDAGEHPEAPVRLREALQPDLRLDALREAAGAEDLARCGRSRRPTPVPP